MDTNINLMMLYCFIESFILTYVVMKLERSLGLLAIDVHKPHKPLIPKWGGIALLIHFSILLLIIRFFISSSKVLANMYPHMLAVIIAGLIGLIDDIVGINAVVKLLVFMIPSIPVIMFSSYVPHPFIPLVGSLRLTIVYPLLIALAYTVLSNAFNMTDTHNGTIMIISLSLILVLGITSILGGPPPIRGFKVTLIVVLFTLLAYAPFNMYPARIFNGNCGSYLIGALMASLIIMSRREFAALLALTPLILNGFSIITSIKGLRSKEHIPRPVVVDERGLITANKSKDSPITLIQLLTLSSKLSEKEIIIAYVLLYLFSSITSILIYYALTLLTT